MSRPTIVSIARDAGAVYKINAALLIDTDIIYNSIGGAVIWVKRVDRQENIPKRIKLL